MRKARARQVEVFILGRGSNLIVPDEGKSLAEGAVSCWTSVYVAGYFQTLFKALADTYDFDLNAPWRDLPERVRTVILTGRKEALQVHTRSRHGREHSFRAKFEGAVPYIKRRFNEAELNCVNT